MRAPARGFTLVELMLSIAIVGILLAIAYPMYRDRESTARAAEMIAKYDALRGGVGADLAHGPVEDCAGLAARLNADNLRDPYARLAIGFERAAPGGYRVVLAVCSEVGQQGVQGVAVTHAAHDVFARTNRVEKGAVLGASLVSFAVPLSPAGATACRTAPANPAVQCGVGAPPAGSGTPPTVSDPPSTGGGPPSTGSGSSGGPQAGASSPGVSGGGTPSAGNPNQCEAQCRAAHPHGNSIAYRNCLAACAGPGAAGTPGQSGSAHGQGH